VLEHRDPLPSPEFGQRATAPTAPPSSGKPTLRPSSSSFNRPPSPPSTQSCYMTPPPSPKLTKAPPPSKKRHCITPSAISSVPDPLRESCHHPSYPATSPHRPHAHAADRAAWEPPTSLGRPHHRAHGHRAVTTPGVRAPRRLASAGWATVPLGRPTVLGLRLESRPSIVRRFPIFNFCLLFQKICINFKNM
jgi:hypothetical protein